MGEQTGRGTIERLFADSSRASLFLRCSLGLAALLMWTYVRNSSDYSLVPWTPWIQPYVAAALLAPAMLVLVLRLEGFSDALTAKAHVVGPVVLAAGLVANALLAIGIGPEALLAGAYLVLDATIIWFAASWIVILSRLEPRMCVGAALLACALSIVGKMLMPLVPAAGRLWVGALMLLACQLLGRGVWREPGMRQESGRRATVLFHRADTLWSLWTVGVCFATYEVVYFCMSSAINNQFGSYSYGGVVDAWLVAASRVVSLAVCAFVAWWVFGHKGALSFAMIWRVMVTLLVLALFSVNVLGNSVFVKVVAAPINALVKALMLIVIADVVRHSDARPTVVVAYGLTFYAVPKYVGYLLPSLGVFRQLTPSVALTLMAVVTLVTVFCAMSQGVGVRSLLYELNNAATPVEDRDRIEARCAELAAEFGLSEREREVMVLMAKGRSKPFIAEELIISDNTVRTYAKHIYDKLGIHSKTDLQDLVGV